MRTPTRLSLLTLALMALLPADLALARWAARSELPRAAARAGVDAAHETARVTFDTGTRWLGTGTEVIGTTLVDAACWLADRAGGAPCRDTAFRFEYRDTDTRTVLRVVPVVVRTRVIVASEDGDCGDLPAAPAAKTPASTPSDS
jgi:hypothetical protein